VFAALLGYNPMKAVLGPTLPHLSHATAAYLTGRSFFPTLITHPFGDGLDEALLFGMVALLLAAGASWLRGGKYHYREPEPEPEPELETQAQAETAPTATGRTAGTPLVDGGSLGRRAPVHATGRVDGGRVDRGCGVEVLGGQ